MRDERNFLLPGRVSGSADLCADFPGDPDAAGRPSHAGKLRRRIRYRNRFIAIVYNRAIGFRCWTKTGRDSGFFLKNCFFLLERGPHSVAPQLTHREAEA
jgi:hypothetical protein